MLDYSAEQIEQLSFVNSAIVLPEIDSTNSYSKQLVRAGEIELPAVIVAVNQTAGRGRQNKSWWSGRGSMCFTLLLPQREKFGLSAIASAIAVCETVRKFHGQLRPSVKWPNDVMLDGKKLCGILIENLATRQGVTLVGIGINTNCSLFDADDDLRQIATSLVDVTGQEIEQQQFLIQLLEMLNSWMNGRTTKGIIDTFMSIGQFETGQPICVETSRFGTIRGEFDGIGMQGELILSIDGKPFVVESGSNVTAI